MSAYASLYKIIVSSMKNPIRTDLMMYQNATFSNILTILDEEEELFDLSGFTPSAQLRKHYESNTAVSFSCTSNTEAGTILMALSAEATANIETGRYVYDLILTADDDLVIRIAHGFVAVNPSVTRS